MPKDEDGSTVVVMKVDYLYEGCTDKIKKSLKGVAGIDDIAMDFENEKVTVTGRVDPVYIHEQVERKTGLKVKLISAKSKKKSNKNEKKAIEPTFSTVVLKLRLHCEGCIERIRKKVLSIEGVASVSIDTKQDLVTVYGVMEPKSLPLILSEKFKRPVEIIEPKKKKEKKENDECDCKKKKKKADEECCGPPYYYPYPYPYPYHPYDCYPPSAPPLPSDENPYSCSIM